MNVLILILEIYLGSAVVLSLLFYGVAMGQRHKIKYPALTALRSGFGFPINIYHGLRNS